MHPWYEVGQKERKARRQQFRDWLKANPDKRLHAGDKRSDGKLFLGYGCGYRNGEHWADSETFQRRLDYAAKKMRVLRKDPEYKERFNAYLRKRMRERPDARGKMHARCKNHRLKKPEMNRARTMRRYARQWGATLSSHRKDVELSLHAEARRLTQEMGVEHQVDHIIPLAAGGWHHHENMQVMPMTVNVQKNDDPFWTDPTGRFKDWRSVPAWLWPDHLVCAYLERLHVAFAA